MILGENSGMAESGRRIICGWFEERFEPPNRPVKYVCLAPFAGRGRKVGPSCSLFRRRCSRLAILERISSVTDSRPREEVEVVRERVSSPSGSASVALHADTVGGGCSSRAASWRTDAAVGIGPRPDSCGVFPGGGISTPAVHLSASVNQQPLAS